MMTDMMVDVETTGNDNPSIFGCFHVAAIKFDAKTGEIGPVFDRVPSFFPTAAGPATPGTGGWAATGRSTMPSSLAVSQRCRSGRPSGLSPSKTHPRVASGSGLPITFDWSVVVSHFQQLGMVMPFHYRLARDLNSYIAALLDDPAHPDMESIVPFSGDKHNALHDCAFQIDMLTEAQRRHVHAQIS